MGRFIGGHSISHSLLRTSKVNMVGVLKIRIHHFEKHRPCMCVCVGVFEGALVWGLKGTQKENQHFTLALDCDPYVEVQQSPG